TSTWAILARTNCKTTSSAVAARKKTYAVLCRACWADMGTTGPTGANPGGAESASQTRRQALGRFLRHARERIRPVDLGLAPGVRRRTPGLRREEVAQLCDISTTWYTWIE